MKIRNDNIQFQVILGKRLIQWGGLSTGVGAVLMMWGSSFWRGVGSQFVRWGIIDALIGGLGVRSAHKNAVQPNAHTEAAQSKARKNLRRFLAVNTGLDILYMIGGLRLSKTKGKEDRFWQGAGTGITLQGGFLFGFDLIHTLLLVDTE